MCTITEEQTSLKLNKLATYRSLNIKQTTQALPFKKEALVH